MNLLARILSHGFAFAVVALLFLVLVYRGDLFQEGELPEFLSFKHEPAATENTGSYAADRATNEQAVTAGVTAVLPESTEQSTAAPGLSTNAGDDDLSPAEAMHAADTESATESDTMPTTDGGTEAGPADSVEPDEGGEAAPLSELSPVEGGIEPPVTVPVTSNESAAESADTETVTSVETITAIEVQPTVTDSSTESAAESADTETMTIVDETITAIEVQPTVTDSSQEDAAESADTATVSTEDSTLVDETSLAVEAPILTAPEEATPAAIEPPVADTVPPPEPLAVPAFKEPPQANTRTETEAPYKVLAKARESFWLRDFETAEQQYRKLTQLEPDNPDGYGELGNMYFSQGKWDEAATAYYEAGTRLLNEGLVPQARDMLEVIRGLNGPQASDLEAQIANATATSP
jgi:hypothetical protein